MTVYLVDLTYLTAPDSIEVDLADLEAHFNGPA
jgi:hypothetical protein